MTLLRRELILLSMTEGREILMIFPAVIIIHCSALQSDTVQVPDCDATAQVAHDCPSVVSGEYGLRKMGFPQTSRGVLPCDHQGVWGS